jgi:uncharacterized protein YuzE
MTTPFISFDAEANALYIRFSDHAVAETLELSATAYLDVDDDGEPVGFEILHAAPELLSAIRSLPDGASLRDVLGRHAA